jgi:hypothetical protein
VVQLRRGTMGRTPLQAASQAWSAYNSAVRIPGLIGSATPLQLVSTAAATWAINSVVIKGSHDAGVLFGIFKQSVCPKCGYRATSKEERGTGLDLPDL